MKLSVVEQCLAHGESSVRVSYACENEVELAGRCYKGSTPSACHSQVSPASVERKPPRERNLRRLHILCFQ